jgi:neutral ceramidase
LEEEKDWKLPGCPRLRALDRNITILDVNRSGNVVARLLFLAVHPTALDHHTPFNSSDFVGRAIAELELASLKNAHATVVGFFNGAEGDVVARRSTRDLADAERLKDTLLANVARTLQSPSTTFESRITTREVVLNAGDGYVDSSGIPHYLAPKPLFGFAALGGSEDDRTALYDLGWVAGVKDVPGEGQGFKLGALDSPIVPSLRFSHLIVPPYAYPAELPVGYVEFGRLKMVAVPFEVSTAAGHAIRQAVSTQERVEIVGLANEYASYSATSDEYHLQDYMGSSTVWGPEQSTVLAWAASCLSRSSSSPACLALKRRDNKIGVQKFVPGKPSGPVRGKTVGFGPRAIGPDELAYPDDGLETALQREASSPQRNLPWFEWVENSLSKNVDLIAPQRHQVSIETRVGKEWAARTTERLNPDNDEGGNFLTLMRRAPKKGETERFWNVIWLAPLLEPKIPTGLYRFRVRITDQNGGERIVYSCSFTVNLTPSRRQGAVPIAPNCS